MKSLSLLLFLLLLICTGCMHHDTNEPPALISVNIIDRNGLNETITNKDRLDQYKNVNFLDHQPYQKVLRVYKKDSQGNSRSFITSYYENGQPKQYLEALNGRAFGLYREWYENGTMKLEVFVISGISDLTSTAEKSWQYEGCARAWDEKGLLLAEIAYEKGGLEGDSLYYHPNGVVWKRIPFHENQAAGTAEYYLETGQLLQTISFCNGERHGNALRFWSPEKIASDEHFNQGRLIQGKYYDSTGLMIAEIVNGEGYRVSFNKDSIHELQEYHEGFQEGEVQVFDENNKLTRVYHMENGVKHGEDVEYVSKRGCEPQARLLLTWYKGKVQGHVKTWYDNGNFESQREMVDNKRNGLFTAWYRDGSLMFIEDYDQDILKKGEYYKKGEKVPVSEINNGQGIATMYDSEGRFIRRISYLHGKPEQ